MNSGLAIRILVFLTALLMLPTVLTAAVKKLDDFEAKSPSSQWTFSNGPEFPGAKGKFLVAKTDSGHGKSGALTFDFTKGGGYVAASTELSPDASCTGISLVIKNTDLAPLAVRVVDSQGQCFQKMFTIKHSNWQKVTVTLRGWQGSWGGPGDGVFRGAPTSFSILARPGSAVKGTIYFDDVSLLSEGSSKPMDTRPVCTISGFDRTIDYDFPGDSKEQGIGGDMNIPGSPTKLYVTLDSKTAGHSIKVRLGSHFQSFMKTLGTISGTGEQTFESTLGDLNDWDHDGGQNDGVARLPLRLLSISVVKGSGPSQGQVTVKSVKVETNVDERSRIVLVPTGRVQGDNARFSCDIYSILTAPANGNLLCRFKDYSGRIIEEKASKASIDAGGMRTISVDLPLKGRSFVECEFSYITPEMSYGPVTSTAVRPLSASGSSELTPQSPFGIGVYLYRYRGPGGDEMMQKAAKLAMDAGVKWSREEMLWHLIEPEKGKFDWSFYDRVVDTATKHGISVYGLIDYWSNWTKPYTKEGIEDYANYCKALIGRYKDRIKHWEIWNEPNIFFWSGPKELYPELLKAAYKAIKEVDPDAKVLGCSTSGIDTAFIKQVMDAGAPFDDLTIHPYRGELDDEGFIKELKDTAKMVDSKPVWITEMGWPTQLQGGVSEREQARLLARTYLCSIASGTVASVSWYDFREDGSNPFYHEHKFGIVRHEDLTPKPAYLALATLANAIGSKPVKEKLDIAPGIFGYKFSDGKQDAIALWSSHNVLLAFDAGSAPEIKNLMGETVKPALAGGKSLISLEAGSPVLISGPALRLKSFEVVKIEHPRATTPGGSVKLVIRNAVAVPELQPHLTAPEGWKVDAGTTVKKEPSFTITAPDSVTQGSVELNLHLGGGDTAVELPIFIEITPGVMEI